MSDVFGNVNVKYNPCKSIAQLKSAVDYILGKRKEQIADDIEKTTSELYTMLLAVIVIISLTA